MRLLSARSGVRIPPSTPSCELSPYIRAFFLFIDSFENLFENLYKKTKKHFVSFFYKCSGINKEYIKLDRDKSTFKSHRDFDSEIEMTFKHF